MNNETIPPQNKSAVIYCRVSTKEQVDEGNSLVSQERLCREYAAKEGYEIAEVYIERGESAKTTDRKELQRMISDCTKKRGLVQAIIAYKVDRISRNMADYHTIKVRLRKYEVAIVSVTEFFEDTPAGRFMENIIANVSQFDNEVRTERSVGGMKEAVHEGRYVWQAPLGYDNVRIDSKATIAPNGDAPLVKEVFELVAQRRYPTDVIRLMMKGKGLLNSKGEAVTRAYFFRLLRKPIYKGVIKMFGKEQKATFPALVSAALFDDVQAVLKGRKKAVKQYQRENPDFPLRRFIQNSEGKLLAGYWATGKLKKRYAYYSFSAPGTTIPKENLEEQFINYLSHLAFDTQHINLLKQQLHKHFGKQAIADAQAKSAVEENIKQVQSQIDTLFSLFEKGSVSEAIFENRLRRHEEELETLKGLQWSKSEEEIDMEGLIKFALKVLKTPHEIWRNGSLEVRRKLQEFVFPKGMVFDGDFLRTPKICNLFLVRLSITPCALPVVNSLNCSANTLSTHTLTLLSPETLNSKEFFNMVISDLHTVRQILSLFDQ